MADDETKSAAKGTEDAPTMGQKLHGGKKAPDEPVGDDPTQTSDGDSNEHVSTGQPNEQGKKAEYEQQERPAQENHDSTDKEAKELGEDTARQDEAQDEGLEQAAKTEASGTEKKDDEKDKKKDDKPAGGYDSIPVPKRPRGWTVRVTIHRARNLPMADINTLSSDPYVISQLYTDTPDRHKEDPPLTMRTPTIRRSTDPSWDWPWTIANVPSSGFKLKVRMYDEDPSNHDDRLGNVHIRVHSMGDNFENIKERAYKIEKRSGSNRAYFVRAVTRCFGRVHHMHGELFVSIELLGRTPEDGQDGRLYTVGPCWWTMHFSPMLGRIANTRDADDDDDDEQNNTTSESAGETKKNKKDKNQTKRYNFQANQIQLAGPVPKELYHRFVEFKPWVQRMFTKSGILGFLTAKALHAQHDRVYHFDMNTKWGRLPEDAGTNLTKLFLDHVHYDQGARIFTYIISLDGLWRFTETGKEFGIDMLSKHTMHSNVGVYIAFSGEFFIRRLKKPREPPPPAATEESSQSHPPKHEPNKTHPGDDVEGGPPREEGPKDPKFYELVIDNDSGTYRPNADLLPLLKKFLALHLPGLHILTLDCQKDADRMNKLKDAQRERKKKEGDGIVYLQGDDSSISSSDEEDLDAVEAAFGDSGATRRQLGGLKTAAKDFSAKEEEKLAKVKREYAGKKRHDTEELKANEEHPDGAAESASKPSADGDAATPREARTSEAGKA